jgi:HK97 family phage major capsid protein
MIGGLKQKRAALIDEARGILDAAESENRDLTAEESQQYDRIIADTELLNARAARAEKLEGLDPIENRKVTERVDNDDEVVEQRKAPESYREFVQREQGVLPQDRPEYREHLYRWIRTGEQIPAEFRVQSKATAGAGLNVVPTSFASLIYAIEREYGAHTTLTQSSSMQTDSGETIQIPTTTAYGVATWTAENVSFPESDDTFGQTPIGAHKLARLVRVSDELLADGAFDLEAYLARQFGESFGIALNTAIAVGTGTGQPQGLIPNVQVGVTLGTGNTTSVTADGLIDLLYSLKPVYRINGTFVARGTTIAAIRKLKDTTNQYIWQPSYQAGSPDTLLGQPIYEDPDVPALAANARSVVFGHLEKATQVRYAGGMEMLRLVERYAELGQVGFRGYRRVDARVVNPEAAKVLVNSAT